MELHLLLLVQVLVPEALEPEQVAAVVVGQQQQPVGSVGLQAPFLLPG